jgi:hypothetical protein
VCCLAVVFLLLGPRLGILLWWLFDMPRWERTFSTFVWPLLGAIFLPWTTLAYVFVFPGGVTGLDWLLLVLAFVLDMGSYTGGGRETRRKYGRMR